MNYDVEYYGPSDLVLTAEQIHVPGMTSLDVKLSLYREFSYLIHLVKHLYEDETLLPESRDWLLSGLLKYIENKGKITLERALGLNKSQGRNPFISAKCESTIISISRYKELSQLLTLVDSLKQPCSLPSDICDWLLDGMTTYVESQGKTSLVVALGLNKASGWNPFDAVATVKEQRMALEKMELLIQNLAINPNKAAIIAIAWLDLDLEPETLTRIRRNSGAMSVPVQYSAVSFLNWLQEQLKDLPSYQLEAVEELRFQIEKHKNICPEQWFRSQRDLFSQRKHHFPIQKNV